MRELQRRLDLIILAHLWVLAPFALVWFLAPPWRSALPPARPGPQSMTPVPVSRDREAPCMGHRAGGRRAAPVYRDKRGDVSKEETRWKHCAIYLTTL